MENQALFRPEARPLRWDRLDRQQQKAVQRILRFLIEATNNLAPPRTGSQQPAEDTATFRPLDSNRSNRAIFINGERGTGKTTVLVSLLNYLHHDATGSLGDLGIPKEISELFFELRQKTIVLEPIDMEPLPEPTNLLAAMLVRVEDKLSRLGLHAIESRNSEYRESRNSESRFPEPGSLRSETMPKLRSALNDLAMSWDGLIQRTWQNQDQLASDTIRLERARLGLHGRLNEILDLGVKELPRQHPQTIFLLPIDDFDLNPSRAPELLRLLRMLSLPRLIFVALGDVAVAEQVSMWANVQALSRSTNLSAVDPIMRDELLAQSSLLASHTIWKLVPPGQRVELKTISPQDVLQFHHPELPDQPSIGLMFERIQMQFKHDPDIIALMGNQPSLATLLQAKHPLLQSLQDGAFGYVGLKMFALTLRKTMDLWQRLNNLITDHTTDTAFQKTQSDPLNSSIIGAVGHDLIELLVDLVQEAFDVDGGLTASVRSQWSDLFSLDVSGYTELTTIPFRTGLRNPIGEPIEWADVQRNRDLNALKVQQPFAITSSQFEPDLRLVEQQYQYEVDSPSLPLGPQQTAGLILVHDLLLLSIGRSVNTDVGPPLQRSVARTATQWSLSSRGRDGSGIMQWPMPKWKSFWHFQLFSQGWHVALEWIRAGPSGAIRRERMGYAWIALATTQLWGQAGQVWFPTKTSADADFTIDWKPLTEAVNQLSKMINIHTQTFNPISAEWRQRVRDWLLDLARLLSPEFGLPPEIAKHFLSLDSKGHDFYDVLTEDAMVLRLRAARTADIARLYGGANGLERNDWVLNLACIDRPKSAGGGAKTKRASHALEEGFFTPTWSDIQEQLKRNSLNPRRSESNGFSDSETDSSSFGNDMET
jgi:hypothetical protein